LFCASYGIRYAYKYGVVGLARSNDNQEILGAFTLIGREAQAVGGFKGTMQGIVDRIGEAIFVLKDIGFPIFLKVWKYGTEQSSRFDQIDELSAARLRTTGTVKHLHLLQVAVLPKAHSKKIGTGLLNFITNICDELQLPCYLETDTERLEKFYTSKGFKTAETFTLKSKSGSVFEPNFGMLRPPVLTQTLQEKSHEDGDKAIVNQ